MTAALPRLTVLATEYGLPTGAAQQLDAALAALASSPISMSSVTAPRDAADVHVADSLVALALPSLRDALRIADLGAGAGFPGLVLAIALPAASVALVESVAKKCAFLRAAVEAAGVPNVAVVCRRAEEWGEGAGRHDLVTARAVAPLPTLLEYAAPLLAPGGRLVAWKGRRDAGEEADGRAAAAALGLREVDVVRVTPFAGAGDRHLHLYLKVGSTPNRYPRRAGMARKRPIRAST